MSPQDDVANWEIFVWALAELGGAHRMVDVEAVFYRCFELAPLRFAWRTRADLNECVWHPLILVWLSAAEKPC